MNANFSDARRKSYNLKPLTHNSTNQRRDSRDLERQTMTKLAILLSLSFVFSACDGGHKHDQDHEDHHDHGKDNKSRTAHTAPHGGTLVKVGDHFAMIELTLDAASGTLDVYFLDGEADKAQLPDQAPAELKVTFSDKASVALKLKGVASSVTGETEAKTSHLRTQETKLKNQQAFTAEFSEFRLKGQIVKALKFPFPEGNDHHDKKAPRKDSNHDKDHDQDAQDPGKKRS